MQLDGRHLAPRRRLKKVGELIAEFFKQGAGEIILMKADEKGFPELRQANGQAAQIIFVMEDYQTAGIVILRDPTRFDERPVAIRLG